MPAGRLRTPNLLRPVGSSRWGMGMILALALGAILIVPAMAGHAEAGSAAALGFVLTAVPELPTTRRAAAETMVARAASVVACGVIVVLSTPYPAALLVVTVAAAMFGAVVPRVGATAGLAVVLLASDLDGARGLGALWPYALGAAVVFAAWAVWSGFARRGPDEGGSPRAAPGWQHALRVGAAVGVAASAVTLLPVDLVGGHWLVTSVLLTIQPSQSQTGMRLAQRLSGNAVGAVIAALLLGAQPPAPVTVGVTIVLFMLAMALRPVNYTWWAITGPPVLLVISEYPELFPWYEGGVRLAMNFAGAAIVAVVVFAIPTLIRTCREPRPVCTSSQLSDSVYKIQTDSGGCVTTLLVEDIGLLVHGDATRKPLRDTTLLIEDGRIAGIGVDHPHPDRVLSAGGLTVIPGLVDGHVHPTFGEWTPAQNSIGWIGNYLHGGTTSMVSAGELHIPGLDFGALTPELVLSIAITSKHTTGRARPSGVKVGAGTVLLVPGMTEEHFDRAHREGIDQLKFIFYDWNRLGDGEAQRYVEWAHQRGMTVKMHSGGVSRSGSSRVAGRDVVAAVRPDIVGHISGGPIPPPDEDIVAIIADVPTAHIEVCSSMNFRATKLVAEQLSARGELGRLTLGTDTPGGTGVIPRGMLRNICFLASICGVDPVAAVAAATGQTAKAHGLDTGVLTEGAPADLLVLGPITGSTAGDALECFALGDLPGIATVLVDGVPLVETRSQQTPPPSRSVSWRGELTPATAPARVTGCC
ncbi:adenine deaminase [Mycolicibacterium mageritense DSM 44476 = CIP 104973]|uniref:Adenine deaminase n=2 Tax=Mycolicibacterium mageritense TaxID=53462 RepID=A0ABM7HZX5_MYCME|nr:FUSC family protein [Mycolicibacterium mageritense]BBX36171.1 hypothetical protein MMAGJ_54530 [Mycolicibacterium mageritense]CDO24285.1 adenine deaminase [Mycolicibacterium mageritense DSM 44476 = CIP 104973]